MVGGVDISKAKLDKWQVTFHVTPSDATLIVKNVKGKVINPISDTTYNLETGIYYYTASKEDYKTIENQRLEVVDTTTVEEIY